MIAEVERCLERRQPARGGASCRSAAGALADDKARRRAEARSGSTPRVRAARLGQGRHPQARRPRRHGRRAGHRAGAHLRGPGAAAASATSASSATSRSCAASPPTSSATRCRCAWCRSARPSRRCRASCATSASDRASRSSSCSPVRTPSSIASVVEDINDPLMHMVRNSLDHGIEQGAARVAAGKRESGRLTLRAFHQGGNIVIEIADDGGGLNTERILTKAREKGLIAPDARARAGGHLSADLRAGLLDRRTGHRDLRPRRRHGRRAPQHRGAARPHRDPQRGRRRHDLHHPPAADAGDSRRPAGRRSASERFVLPTFSVRESLRPTAAQVHTVQGAPRMIQVREELMPLMWLTEVFDVPGEAADPTAARWSSSRTIAAGRAGGRQPRGQAGSRHQVARRHVRRRPGRRRRRDSRRRPHRPDPRRPRHC